MELPQNVWALGVKGVKTEFVRQLIDYIESYRAIFFINHFDLVDVERIIERLQENASGMKFLVKGFNPALGQFDPQSMAAVDAEAKFQPDKVQQALFSFLRSCHEQELQAAFVASESFAEAQESGENTDYLIDTAQIIVLQDCSAYLNEPEIVSMLKVMADKVRLQDHYQVVVLLVSPVVVLPPQLEEYITLLDIPTPDYDEISKILRNYVEMLWIDIDDEAVNELSRSLKGLNAFQIRQILNQAYHNSGTISSSDQYLVLQEKAQIIRKSGILELMNYTETIDDIGGLESLKEWLTVREKIYKNFDRALRFGVDAPRGVLIFGMPGCGKSLCAKATAKKFGLPLTRLDVGRLLGKYVGESENNMRRALSLAEAISPCVLWIDELEKAFAGVGSNGGGHEVTSRLFGQFLTWMQEKESSVFIVATANSIKMLPPEFMRKGRFDEIFFVDLPNADERQQIIKIHLKKRKKWNYRINTNELVEKTEGYSGADLETVVKTAIESAFVRSLQASDRSDELTTQDLLEAQESIKSISQSMGKQIEELKNSCKEYDIRSASKSK